MAVRGTQVGGAAESLAGERSTPDGRMMRAVGQSHQRLRLLAVMSEGIPGKLPETWRRYGTLDEARIGAVRAMRDASVLGVAIVEDHNGPLRLMQWMTSDTRADGQAGPVRGLEISVPTLLDDLSSRILDGSPDAILVCDREGVLRYWNRGAERVFGFVSDEARGASMEIIIPERLRARHWAGWHAAMSTGITHYRDGRLLRVPALHKDGRQISIEFSIQLLKDSAGTVEWVVAVARDVTEQYAREKALRAELNAQRQATPSGPGPAAA